MLPDLRKDSVSPVQPWNSNQIRVGFWDFSTAWATWGASTGGSAMTTVIRAAQLRNERRLTPAAARRAPRVSDWAGDDSSGSVLMIAEGAAPPKSFSVIRIPLDRRSPASRRATVGVTKKAVGGTFVPAGRSRRPAVGTCAEHVGGCDER